ncbi:hypothetical protein L6258_03410, partial [Candidatus Parcubacteria bacterium]|nr:hypothetical protein [Candidatus Parcubacteria bacterium]
SGILSDVLHDSRKPVPVLVANWIINRPDQIKGLTPQEVANKILREQTQETIGAQQLEALAQKTILENESTVADYKKGKTNAIQFLLGQLMRRAEGKVDPVEARKLLEELLARIKIR